MDVLFTILTAMTTGFVIGSAARFAVPGPDPMPFWLTVVIGLVGSAIGTAIGAAIFGADHTFDSSGHSFVSLLLAIGFATALVAVYRIFVQKRPLIGPEARHFPHRGFGVAKMRKRLRLLGIDPDPATGGVGAGVTYLVFQDTRVPDPRSSASIAAAGKAAAARFLARN